MIVLRLDLKEKGSRTAPLYIAPPSTEGPSGLCLGRSYHSDPVIAIGREDEKDEREVSGVGGNATREVRDREDARGGELREGEIRAPRRDRAGRRRENPRPEAHPISQGRRPDREGDRNAEAVEASERRPIIREELLVLSTLAIMGGHCLWDGTLSPNDFIASADDLAKKWKAINPNLPQWAWIPCQRIGVSCNAEGYLALENMYQLSASEVNAITDDETYSAEEGPSDNATLIQSYNDDIHIYDFHIVYSFSYRVPVLYFRGYRCDGHPLHLCDIEKDLPPHSAKIRNESKWTFMTQEEHPYLCCPWYTLHPCGTSDWMKLLLGSNLPSKNPADMLHYLSAWLSVVGQTVGLRIPLELHNKSV